MSKYTTEVRFICEQYAGRKTQGEYTDVQTCIDNSYDKIFDIDNIPTFPSDTSKAHQSLLFKKILLHYYSREIAYETVGLWKLKLNTKLKEIMPYYNQLYESELITFNPLENRNLTKTHEGEYNDDEKVDNARDTSKSTAIHESVNSIGKETLDGTARTTGEEDTTENTTLRHSKTTTQGNDTRTNVVNSDADSWVLFSDTPQGGINGIVNAGNGSLSDNSYLTNATHNITTPDGQTVTDTHGNIVETYNADGDKSDTVVTNTEVDTTTKTDNITDTSKTEVTDKSINEIGKITDDNAKNTNGTDSYENKEIGKDGVITYSQMLNEYRDTFLNIDLQVINSLESLFMQLW